jgi:pyruvate/2-oxoglutarate dehydrogenase complex dihydrolipoamide dehydrogenase (E3) component
MLKHYLNKKPSSLIVIGGRALGLEFAQMYSRLGTKVTLLQRSKKIIPDHEPKISDNLTKYFVGEGIEIITTVNATNSINEIAVRGVENFNKSLELTQRYYNDIVKNNFNYARKIERSYNR